jgi:hypothetical protein
LARTISECIFAKIEVYRQGEGNFEDAEFKKIEEEISYLPFQLKRTFEKILNKEKS